ncbi:MAG: STAS domain-containing protein [Candidatus Binatia bacterium]
MEQSQEGPIFLTERDGKPLLVLQGAVDIFAAEQLHRLALSLAERGEDAVVDCEKAEQIGSAAFQILLTLKDGLRVKGSWLLLHGVSDAVMHQLHTAGLAGLLTPVETEI